MLLVYSVRCQIGGTEGRERCMQGGTDRHDRGRDRGRKFQKIGAQHDGKNLFCAFFLIFSKKLFRAQNLCFLLFSPVLRTTTRACVFIIFEKNCPKKFFEKPIDSYAYSAYNRHCQQDSGTPPDSLTGTVPTV